MATWSANVIPGKSLGPFFLGMPISMAISAVQSDHKSITAVELKYSAESLLDSDIIIDLLDQGLMLRFEPRSQRLRMVEAYDLAKIHLKYSNASFSGPDTVPSFKAIYGRFGPSFPGVYDQKRLIYNLHYPGISFSFPIPPIYENLKENELPLEFADGSTPVASRLYLYHGSHENPIIPITIKKKAGNDPYYYEKIEAVVGKGLKFPDREANFVKFGDSVQDVVTVLGSPDSVYEKTEDKMRIHNTSNSNGSLQCKDYFYNYFQLGFDILFDLETHSVKKFVLHTNFPCHYDFNVYKKCNFIILFHDKEEEKQPEEADKKGAGGDLAKVLDSIEKKDREKVEKVEKEEREEEEELERKRPNRKGHHKNRKQKKKRKKKGKEKVRPLVHVDEEAEAQIDPDMKWSQIQEQLPSAPSKPMVYSVSHTANPFGATLFYALDGIVFEVMKNEHLASVCLFAKIRNGGEQSLL